MRRCWYRRYRLGFSIALSITLLTVVAYSDSSLANSEPQIKKIPFDKNHFKENKAVTNAIANKPLPIREFEIEAPLTTVKWLLNRADLTWKILEDYGVAPGFYEEDEGIDQYRASSSGFYTFNNHYPKEELLYEVSFEYARSVGFGGIVKLSGSGILILKMKSSKDGAFSIVDYDLYIAPGKRPLDGAAGKFSLHGGMVNEDVTALLTTFTRLCEKVDSEPEMVLDDMEFSEGSFTEKEIKDFRGFFID